MLLHLFISFFSGNYNTIFTLRSMCDRFSAIVYNFDGVQKQLNVVQIINVK